MVSNRNDVHAAPAKLLEPTDPRLPHAFSSTRTHCGKRGFRGEIQTTNAMTSAVNTPTQSFEDALTELESLVDTLEQGELTLGQSLAAFERGIKLTRTCQTALDKAEQQVRILSGESPEAEPAPFENIDPNGGS